MKDATIEKLRATLASKIDSECKVVYLLCEIRKLLEKQPPDPVLPALKLYCHWALHVDLTKARTTLPFLKRVDEFVDSVYGKNAPRDAAAEQRMYDELHIFSTFKEELRRLLVAYGLPSDLCDDAAQWRELLRHYAGVIDDGTLSCRAKNGDLKHVNEVVFSKGRLNEWPEDVERFLPFDLNWTILLLDGNKLTVSTNAWMSETGQPLMNSGISLNL